MERVSAREMISLISDEFERCGWRNWGRYPTAAVEQMRERHGLLDPAAAARLAPKCFLLANSIDAEHVRDALARVGAERQLHDEPPTTGKTVNNTFNVSGDNNNISDVHVGDQTVTLESTKEESLQAVGWLVREALCGNVHEQQLQDLSEQLQMRGDVAQGDIERVTGDVIESDAPEQGRLVKMRASLMTSAASGLLVQGIVAAVGAAL